MAGEKSRVESSNNSLILAVILRSVVYPRPSDPDNRAYVKMESIAILVHKEIVTSMTVLVNGQIELFTIAYAGSMCWVKEKCHVS